MCAAHFMKMITKDMKDNFNSYDKEMLFKQFFAQGIIV